MFTLFLSASLAAFAPSPAPPAAPVVIAAPAPLPSVAALPSATVLPPIDPARLALARTTANALFRDGTVARMLDQMLSFGPNGYASTMLDMTLGDMMAMMPQGPSAPPKDTPESHMTLRQMALKHDPYFNQRMAAIHDAVVAEAVRLGPKFEPQMRDGLATSMARRFTPAQLGDLSRFFSTDAGRAFGGELYLMWMDPAVFRSMMSTMPALSAELPGAMQRVMAANARFPSPAHAVPPPPKPAPKKPATRGKK